MGSLKQPGLLPPVLAPRIAIAVGLLTLAGCGGSSREVIRIDGSSTVYPISQVAAELFAEQNPRVKISVSQSGTSAGMGKFLRGEIDICDASRPIRQSEREKAEAAGMEIIEFTVAQDGLAIVVNPANDWCEVLTVEQLRALWRPEADGVVNRWSDVEPQWPEEPLKLYGPGTASGTFEYFTEAIMGEKQASRPDYTPSENDNMLVRGVAGDRGALGYFGFAYYVENQEKLKLIGVDNGEGPVKPTLETIRSGDYEPLSRPLFIYVARQELARPEMAEFIRFYIENSARLATEAKYVPVADETSMKNAETLETVLSSMKPAAAE